MKSTLAHTSAPGKEGGVSLSGRWASKQAVHGHLLLYSYCGHCLRAGPPGLEPVPLLPLGMLAGHSAVGGLGCFFQVDLCFLFLATLPFASFCPSTMPFH
jgi:hypothetical protein